MSLNLNTNNFSLSKKFAEFIVHPDWQDGYNEVAAGEYDDPSIKLSDMDKNAALYYFLSSSCDEIASSVYSKIKHMVQSLRDIETCDIHSLLSLAKEVEVDNLDYLNIDYLA